MAEPNQARTIEIPTRTILNFVWVILGLLVAYQIRDIILVFLIAVTLASALEPLVAAAYRRLRLPRSLTVLLVYIFVIGGVGLFFYLLAPSFVSQFKELGTKYHEFLSGPDNSLRSFLERIGAGGSLTEISQGIIGTTQSAIKTTLGVVNGLLQFVAILVISFYLVVEQGAIREAVKQMLPQEHREKAVQVVTTIQRKLGLWLLGQVILSFLIFIFTYVALTLLNVPFALALAAVAGILEILPYIGPIISAIPAILIAFTISPTLAIIVALLYVLIQQLEGYIFVPKIMEKTVGLHPLLVLLSVLTGLRLAGVIGGLLAVPVLAAGSVLYEAYALGNMPKVPEPVEDVLLK